MSLWDTFKGIVDGAETAGQAVFNAVGNAIGGAAESIPGAGIGLENLARATNTVAQGASYGISAMPGGMRTMSWDDAGHVSPGQAGVTNAAILERQAVLPVAKAFYRTQGVNASDSDWDQALNYQAQKQNTPWLAPSFDVTDEQQRQAAFSDNPLGKTWTGGADAVFDWYGDGGVILGKGLKVLRTGTNVAGKTFMGYTSRTIRTVEDVSKLSQELDLHEMWLKSGGLAGKETPLGTAVQRTLSKDPAAMALDPFASKSTNPGLVAALLGESGDFTQSSLIVKAGMGNADAMAVLQKNAASTADAIERARALEQHMADQFNKPIGKLTDEDIWVRRPEDVEKIGRIVADLEAKDAVLQRALELESRPIISKAGSTSVTVERFKAKYLADRAEFRMDPTRQVSSDILERNMPQWADRVYQRNQYVRPVRVVARAANWAQGVRPAGWVGIKGDLYNDSFTEIFAELNGAKALGTAQHALWKRDAINNFLTQPTVSGRMNALTQMEREASRRIAATHGISADVADSMYKAYNRSRMTASEYLGGRGYMIDVDGTVVKSPALVSQLADSVPMMDLRTYEDLIRRHKEPLRRIVGASEDAAQSVLEPIYTFWKATVLFRLGYTIRNVAEGNARALAAYGHIPAFTDPWGTIKRMASNDVRRASMGRNYVYELATNNRPKVIRTQIDMLRDAQDAVERQMDTIRLQSDLQREVDWPDATGVDRLSREAYYQAAAEHGTKFDLADLELGVGSISDSLLPTRQRAQFLALHAREQAGEILTGADVQAYRHLRAKAARTRLRELQAQGQDIVIMRGGKPVAVKNIRELADDDLVPLANTRKGAPAAAVEAGDIPVDSIRNIAGTRTLPDVYVMPRWRRNIKTATGMREAVPGRVARQARVRNPKPLNSYDYYLDDVDRQVMLSGIDQIRDIEEQLSTLYGRLDASTLRRSKMGTRKRLGDEDVFNGSMGSIARMNSSADATYENFLQGQMSRYEIHHERMVNSWGPIAPGQPQYFSELARVVNQQFKNDPLATRALQGVRRADAVRWLNSKDGAWYRKEMQLASDDAVGHVGQVYDMVESYIPDASVRAKAAVEDLVPAQLESELRGADLSRIHGRQVQLNTVSGALVSKAYRAGITKMYRLIGSAPEDLAARHPFYRQMHMAEQSRLTRLAADQGVELTDAVLERIRRQAHSFALKTTKDTLYTIDRYSNPAYVLRWIMPFFPAYENTIKTWLRIGLNDPSVIARASLIWEAPNKMGLVVDKEGNPLPAGEPFSKGAYVVLPQAFRDFISSKVPGGQVPDFPKGSANFVLPGDSPFLPGMGFTVATPVQWWISNDPVREDKVKGILTDFFGPDGADQIYRQFVPFGVADGDITSSTLSGSLKQAVIAAQGPGNQDFMMRALGIYRDAMAKYMTDGGEKPTAEWAIAQAGEFSKLRFLSALTQPLALRWRSPYQMYIDEYHRLTTQYGWQDGEAKFLGKYPEYSILMQSLSSNPTGMSADMAAYKTYQENTGLWNKVTGIDPKFGQMVTNPVSRGEFNGTVYAWQNGTPIRPGTSDTIHGQQDIQSFQKAANIAQGWQDYHAAKTAMDNWMARNGFTTLRDKGAEQGADMWRQWLAQQEGKNPDWYTQRQSFMNNSSIRQTITALDTIVADDRFVQSSPDRAMWTLVRDYLEKRDMMVAALAQRDAAGGSASLDAKSNADVADLWARYAEKLRNANTSFAAFYDRWLDSDDLSRVTVTND